MIYKLPYYMVYPFTYGCEKDGQRQRDREYLQSMYPLIARKTIPWIEEELDRLEYEGSPIYDEYPDKLILRLLCTRIHEKVQTEIEEEVPREIIEILVYDALCNRRACRL